MKLKKLRNQILLTSDALTRYLIANDTKKIDLYRILLNEQIDNYLKFKQIYED